MDYKFIDAEFLNDRFFEAQELMYEKIEETKKGRDIHPAQDDALCILLLVNYIIQNKRDLLEDSKKNLLLEESASWIKSVVGYCNLSTEQIENILRILLTDIRY